MSVVSVNLVELVSRIGSNVDIAHVRAASIQEEVRLLEPVKIYDLVIHILDESSRMHTRSFKAVTALMCVADCLRRGMDAICFTSGANTGMALASYANRVGIRTHFFIPAGNLWKLNGNHVNSPLSRVYAVENTADTKTVCHRFAHETGIPLMPETTHWREAGRLRGAAIESLLDGHLRCDWLVQAVCAGFGPIGIYEHLFERCRKGYLRTLPRFLGIQQSANCALARHLKPRLCPGKVVLADGDGRPIEEIMYDSHPETYGTFPNMEAVIRAGDGALLVLGNSEYNDLLESITAGRQALEHIERCGIRLAMRHRENASLEVVQRAGLMSIMGTIKAVRIGLLAGRTSALCSFGAGAATGVAEPIGQERLIAIPDPCEPFLRCEIRQALKGDGRR